MSGFSGATSPGLTKSDVVNNLVSGSTNPVSSGGVYDAVADTRNMVSLGYFNNSWASSVETEKELLRDCRYYDKIFIGLMYADGGTCFAHVIIPIYVLRYWRTVAISGITTSGANARYDVRFDSAGNKIFVYKHIGIDYQLQLYGIQKRDNPYPLST